MIVGQVQEDELPQTRQMLDCRDQIVLEVEKLQFIHCAQLGAFLKAAPERFNLGRFRIHVGGDDLITLKPLFHLQAMQNLMQMPFSPL